MNIVMMTNTYLPFVGGVARSVELFSKEFRTLGHKVLIVAPSFENTPHNEPDIVRVPALQKFNSTEFSVQIPIPGILNSRLNSFEPDIVHSHHPFIIGDTALRIATEFQIPIVYTFHTFYEAYTHYVPGDSPALKRFVSSLVAGYANLCDYVFAPSKYAGDELRNRGVHTLIETVPTGIEIDKFKKGKRKEFRKKYGIPPHATVLGFVSRIAAEKNIDFLSKAVNEFILYNSNVHFLVVGDGPLLNSMRQVFDDKIHKQTHFMGILTGDDLVNAYSAMDIFVFASKTETQGLVIAEAMAAGLPVVALDGPVLAEMIDDTNNGKLVQNERIEDYNKALQWITGLHSSLRKKLRNNAVMTSRQYSKDLCVKKALTIYNRLLHDNRKFIGHSSDLWARTLRVIQTEYELMKNILRATQAAINS